jgi:hypothetical protein
MADLILTIPSSLDRAIFPWSTAVLRDYLKNSSPEIDVHIWDLRNEEKILVLFEEYRDYISKTVSLMQRDELGMSAGYGSLSFLSVMLKFDSDIFPILQSESVPFNINIVNRFQVQGSSPPWPPARSLHLGECDGIWP